MDQSVLRDVVGLTVLLQIVSWALTYWPWAPFPRLAPTNYADLQGLLWEIEAGLLTIAIPAVFVIVQFTGSLRGNIAALPIGEVLRNETGFLAIAAFVFVGFIHSGADAIWFQGQAVLFEDFVVVIVATVAFLALMISRFLSLVGNPDQLRRKAEDQLQRKLREAIEHAWAVARANQDLVRVVESMSQFKGRSVPRHAVQRPTDWVFLRTDRAARVRDVNLSQLVQFLNELPPRPASEVQGATSPGTRSQSAPDLRDFSDDDLYLMFLIDDSVAANQELIALRSSSFDDLDPGRLTQDLLRALEMDPHAT